MGSFDSHIKLVDGLVFIASLLEGTTSWVTEQYDSCKDQMRVHGDMIRTLYIM